MITIITNALFATSLFITGGNVLSTNFKLHHYSDKDYEELFHLKNKNSIVLNCTKHSELENIKKQGVLNLIMVEAEQIIK